MRTRSIVAFGLFVIAAVVVASLIMRVARHDQSTIDTVLVIEGTHRALQCVDAGELTECGYDAATETSAVGAFPALQYFPAATFVALDVTDETARDLLMWLNLVAVVTAIAVVVRRAWTRGGAAAAVVALVVMTTGMLVPYAGASFGEPLALLALVVACRLALARAPTVWLAVACAAATMGKETMFPIVVLCVVGFVCFARGDRSVMRRKALWAGSGIAAGVVANLAFNVFRFGTWRNVQYLGQGRRPDVVESAKNAASLLIAPNGGIVWFWFGAAAAVGMLVVVLVRSRSRVEQVGVVAVLGALAIGIVGAAVWWMPFGWYSWGPRLVLVPFAPVVFAAVETWPSIASRRTWLAACAVAIVSLLLVAPQIGFIFEPETTSMNHWLLTTTEHPECTTVDRRTVEGAAVHHACTLRAAWRTDAMPLVDAVREASHHDTAWYWATVVGAFAVSGGALVLVRREQRRSEAPRHAA